MTTTTIMMFDLLVKATLLLGVAHLLLIVTRRRSAGTRHLILASALIATLALPFTAPLSVIEVPALPAVGDLPATPSTDRLMLRFEPSPSEPARSEATPTPIPARDQTSPVTAATTDQSAARPGADPTAAPGSATVTLPIPSFAAMNAWIRDFVASPLLFLGIWAFGAAILLLHLLVGITRVHWMVDRALPVRDEESVAVLAEASRRIGLERTPKMFVSPDLSVPVVWGIRRPILLLPIDAEEWSSDRREAVLLHELAHISRRDGLTLILSRLATSVYWFHPLAWSAARMARRLCERACDDIVLQRGTLPSDYADHLLAIARRLPDRETMAAVTLAMSRRSEIEGRLLAILHPDLRRSSITRRSSVLAAVVATLLMLSVSAFRLTADEPDPTVEAASAGPAESSIHGHDPDMEMSVSANGNGDESRDGWLESLFEEKLEAAAGEAEAEYTYEYEYEYEYETHPHPNWNTNTNSNSNTNTSSNWSSSDAATTLAENRERKRRIEEERSESKSRNSEGARYWEQAWNAHQDSRYDVAIPLFMKTAELDYRREASLYNIACGYAMSGDADQAVAWLRSAVDAGFDDWHLLTRDSDLDPIRTDRKFKEFLGSLPEKMGRKTEKHGRNRLDEALAEFAELHHSNEARAEEWSEVGRHLLGLRRLDEADVALRKAIAISASPAVIAMYNLGCVESLRGNDSQALRWLDRAIESGLDRSEKMRSDPDLASLKGNPQFEALVRKSETLSLDRFWKGRHDNESRAEQAARWKPAIAEFTRYTSSRPDSGRAWWNLGWAQHHSGMYEVAIDSFERALRLGYRPANTSYNIACGHARLGHEDLAFQWLDRARELGFEMGDRVRWDEDLASLRNDRRALELFGPR